MVRREGTKMATLDWIDTGDGYAIRVGTCGPWGYPWALYRDVDGQQAVVAHGEESSPRAAQDAARAAASRPAPEVKT